MTLTRESKILRTKRESLLRAAHQSRIEGLEATEFARDLFKQLEHDQLTVEQVRAKLIAHHKVG
jgi:hypothetical protein